MYEILPEGLYLCSVMATKNKRQMEQMGITHILSLGHEPMNIPDNGITKYFDILDDDDADLYLKDGIQVLLKTKRRRR